MVEGDPIEELLLPQAIAEARTLVEQIEAFVAATPYLKTQTEEGDVHPGRYAIGAFRRLLASMHQRYGETLFDHAMKVNDAIGTVDIEAPLRDHLRED